MTKNKDIFIEQMDDLANEHLNYIGELMYGKPKPIRKLTRLQSIKHYFGKIIISIRVSIAEKIGGYHLHEYCDY